jgi:hypothetical protein
MVNGWARFTGQDETVFASRVYREITKLVIRRYQATGHPGVTDSQANDQPEAAFDFVCDLFNILHDATPADKMTALVQQMWATLITAGTQPIEVDNKLLHDVSAMLTSEAVSRMSEVLSKNPSAKDRLLHPLFGALIAMAGDKYGWESGVPTHNYTQLQSVLAQNGISTDKRILSHGLKRLGRKNLSQNMSNALVDKLTDNLDKIIKEQVTKEQNKTQSIWVYWPISPDASAETEKSVREWLFRRNNDRANRNY